MRAALRRSSVPIVASAATVALGLLALLLSDLTNNRALGPVGAIGIVCAVLSSADLPARRAGAARPGRLLARPAARTTASGGRAACGAGSPALVDRAPRRVWAATPGGARGLRRLLAPR